MATVAIASSTAVKHRAPSQTSADGGRSIGTVDEAGELRLVLARDESAWRRFVARYGDSLRAVVRHARGVDDPLSDDQVNDVLGDFWLALVADDMRLLRAFDPSHGASLLTWLTFHVAHVAYAHLRQRGREPMLVSLNEARNVAAPRVRSPRLRSEAPAESSIEGAIRNVVRDVIAAELRSALGSAAQVRGAGAQEEEGFISIGRAAEIADTHPATIRSWIRSGRLQAGRAGRHYKVRKSDVINVINETQVIEVTRDSDEAIARIMADDRGD